MSLEAKARVSLENKNELESFFVRSESSAKRFATGVTNELRTAGRELSNFASMTARSLAAIGGFGAGVGIAAQAKDVLELRDAVAGLASVGGLADDQLGGMREQINATAIATKQLQGNLGEALNEFVARTGDIEEGRKQLELWGRVATATRSQAKEIAVVGGEFGKLGIKSQAEAFAVLAKQSDVGSVELKDLVSQGPRLFSAFQLGGLSGIEGLRRGGAFTQIAQKATGSVERTSTAVEAAFRDVALHQQQLHESGIDVFDQKTGASKDRIGVILDIIRKSKGDERILRRIFGEEGIRAVLPLAAEFRQTGGFATFEQFANVKADSSVIDRKFALNSSTGIAKLRDARIRALAGADSGFGDTIESLTGLFPAAAEFAVAHPVALGAAGFGARVVGGLAGKALFGAGGSRIGGAIAGGAIAEAEAATAGGQKVFVTNWPTGGLFDGGGATSAAGKVGEAIAEKARLGLLPRALAALTGGGAATIAAGAALGAAGSLAVLAHVTSPLNEATKRERDALERQLKGRQEQLEENRRRKDQQSVDETVEQVRRIGHSGGRVSGAMAGLAARAGYSYFGESAGDVIQEFAGQQTHLRQIALGYRSGLDTRAVGESVDGGSLIIKAIEASNPEFAKGDAKSRARILEKMVADNEREAKAGYRAYNPQQPGVGSGIEYGPAAPTTSQGIESYFGNLQSMFGQLADVLGLKTLNITINGDGVSVEGGGTRSPEVTVRRTTGAN